MSFENKPINPNEESLPKTVAEVKAILKRPDLAQGLLTRIQTESDQKARWADRNPVCAQELVQTLFSKAKLSQLLTPFFSLCATDPGLKKALLKMASGAKAAVIHESLEKNIETIAQDPILFFNLAGEALTAQNRQLVLVLLKFCNKDRAFTQKNLQLFSRFIEEVVALEDLVVLEDLFAKGLDDILEKKSVSYALNGGLDLGLLLSNKQWNMLDLLVQYGRVSGMQLPRSSIAKGDDREKINLLLANGVIVDPPSEYEYDRLRKARLQEAYALHLMYTKLHSADLTPKYLESQSADILWNWICQDRDAAKVLIKHPDFFLNFLKQSRHFNSFDKALKAYVAAGIFDPIALGIPLLFKAIDSNQCEAAKALIDCGVPLNAIDPQREWSTLEAVMRSVDLAAPLGQDLLYLFLNHPKLDCRMLFKDHVHPIDVLLQSKAPNKHLLLKALLDKGFSLKGLKFSLFQGVQSLQPYDLPTFKLLISSGIPLDEVNSEGDSLLHVLIHSYSKAISFNRSVYLELIVYLAILDPKGIGCLANRNGRSPLALANDLEVIMVLLHAGIAPKTAGEGTLLHNDWKHLDHIYTSSKMPTTPQELQRWIIPYNLRLFFGDALEAYAKHEGENNQKQDSYIPGYEKFSIATGFITALLSVFERN